MISSYDSERVHDNRDRIEEMRRLLFVTSTRARDVLYVTGNAVAYKSKSDDGRITKVVYNRFLMDSLSVIFGRTVTIDDMARWHAAFNAGKAKHKALTAPAKPKKKTSKKKKSSKAPVSEPSAAPETPEIIRPVKKLSGMTVWAKKRCKKHGRKSRKGGKR
jgi:ATP-dependent exoDNAse (exonuclease V) beta subunit